MATNSRHSHTGQTYCGLPCDSRRLITAEPAHHNRVESPPRNSEPNLGDMVNSSGGHVCHSPQHASSPVYVSSSGALSTGGRCSVTRLAGEVDVHVSTVSEAQDHSGERSDINSHLVAITTMVSTSTTCTSVCGPPSLLSILLGPTVTTGLCLGWQVIPSARMEALMQHYQAAGFSKESLDSPQFLEGPLQTEGMTIGGFASLPGPQDKVLIPLVPQLLK